MDGLSWDGGSKLSEMGDLADMYITNEQQGFFFPEHTAQGMEDKGLVFY